MSCSYFYGICLTASDKNYHQTIPSFLLRPKLLPVLVAYNEGLSEGAKEG